MDVARQDDRGQNVEQIAAVDLHIRCAKPSFDHTLQGNAE
jgi:hypothetical protein